MAIKFIEEFVLVVIRVYWRVFLLIDHDSSVYKVSVLLYE